MARRQSQLTLCFRLDGFKGIFALCFLLALTVWLRYLLSTGAVLHKSIFGVPRSTGVDTNAPLAPTLTPSLCRDRTFVHLSVSCGYQGDLAIFSVNRQIVHKPASERGINVVAIDPWTASVTLKKSYDTFWHQADLAEDLASIPIGHAVMVAVDGSRSENLDALVLNALHKLGAHLQSSTIPKSYVLIGVQGNDAIAQSEGSHVYVQGVMPCAVADNSSTQDLVAISTVTARPLPTPAAAPPPSMQPPVPSQPSQDKSTAETTWRCVGESHNRSCVFRNLYFSEGDYRMFLTYEQTLGDISLRRANKYEGTWVPRPQRFQSSQAIADHVASKLLLEEAGLSVHFNPLFPQNIGHGIFDGLYPAFVATVRLGLQDRTWLPVVGVPADCFAEPAAGGLSVGDIVETYLPHPKHGRTPRTVHARILTMPTTSNKKSNTCKTRKNLDSRGIEMGATHVGDGDGALTACCTECSRIFGCRAGVHYEGICYFKGKCLEGVRKDECTYHKDRRTLCYPAHSPPSDIAVKPLTGELSNGSGLNVSESWVIGKVRSRCMAEGIYEEFGGAGQMRRLFEMERDSRNNPALLLRFEEIVFGVGGVGNMIMDTSGAIGGSLPPVHAMSQFRDRMYRSYGFPVADGGFADNHPLGPDKELNVIVISNKRYTADDRRAIMKVIDELNSKGRVKAEYIDWGKMGKPPNKFKKHLQRVIEADVYVSSIGTALQYVPFLRNGRAYVALGAVWQRSGRYFPTFMEQQLAGGGTPFLRTFYADPGAALRNKQSHPTLGEDGFFVGIGADLLRSLVAQAESAVRQGFQLPVPPKENLSPEGQILLDLCKLDKRACGVMQEARNGGVYECALLLWMECIVYEVGPWQDGGKCGMDHRRLRKLRKQYALSGYGAPDA